MLEHFFIYGQLPSTIEKGEFIPLLVLASYIVASVGSFTGLTLATNILNAPTMNEKRMLHWVGAFALGSGIWSMHFIGMLAYKMHMEVNYNPWLTGLSMAIAILAAYGVLQITRNPKFSAKRLIISSIMLGLSICSMHYLGMAAMEMRADVRHIPGLFFLSVAIAIGASAAALWIVFYLTKLTSSFHIIWRTMAALLMGAAICGMHYTGMEATVMIPFADCGTNSSQSFNGLAIAVIIITCIIFAIAFAVMAWGNQKRNLAIMEDKVRSRTEELEETMGQLKIANLKAEAATRDVQENLVREENANKAKSDFLANMSHELRTPMNGVLGMAHLLSETKLDDEQRSFVSTINGSAESLLILLNDILDFSKIEAGAMVLEYIPFGVKNTISQITNLLRLQADKKRIDLRVDVEEDVPDYIWGDPGRLRQIITNLMGNAIKFTDSGHVRLYAYLEESDQSNILHVNIEDTGMGIPEKKLKEVFDKFTQGDSSITRKYGGTGLGLAITKQLVNLMGGTIGVESAEGKGSTFWFTIPYKPAEKKDLESLNDQRNIHSQTRENLLPIAEAKVLLVEDYYVNQLFAEKLLKKFGFKHIDVAENGIKAIEKYRAKKYDMIFMDCQMPEMDGYQATGKIRAFEEDMKLHTPIIAMTANAMMGDREKCLNAGMDDYLSKPLRVEHVRKLLQAWFAMDANKAVLSSEKQDEAPAEATKEAPVDMSQLRMFTDGDPQEEKEIISLFLDQARTMLDALQNSMQPSANDAWKSAAHRLKGASGNLGAMKLHHLCNRAETHFDDDEAKKAEMLKNLWFELKRVETYFNA